MIDADDWHRHRPAYHFLPPANWMNDPNGPIFYKGKYHLFYQHNPHGAFWGTMHWGHAVSSDLINWLHLPIALAPTPGGPDKDGCFSGCAIVDDAGTPTILYTGVSPEVQCLAVSHDDLLTWEKYAGNPIIPAPPEGWTMPDFRDPQVWKEGDDWLMLVGTGIKDVGGTALLYRSSDLLHWEYLHPLCIGDKNETGTIWECPDFFPLGEKWVLLVSPIPLGKTLYFIGTYADRKFTPESHGMVDFGDFYAAKSCVDGEGRRILWGWVWEGRSVEAQKAAGWAGAMALPRILTLSSDNTLQIEPAEAFQSLRHLHRSAADIPIVENTKPLLGEDFGTTTTLQILAQFSREDASQYGLKIRCSPDGSEQTLLYYDAAAQRLCIDREKSSLSPDVVRDAQSGPLLLGENELLTLEIFLDGSLIEIYANSRACLTTRIYPTLKESGGIIPFAVGGNATLKTLDVWAMRSAVFSTAQ